MSGEEIFYFVVEQNVSSVVKTHFMGGPEMIWYSFWSDTKINVMKDFFCAPWTLGDPLVMSYK